MNDTKRNERNQQRRTELYPVFEKRIAALVKELESQGLRPRIQDAWRSPEKQHELFVKGNSQVEFGFHNVTGLSNKKEALAVDMLDDDAPLNPSVRYLLMLAAAARKLGLRTGILWGLKAADMAKVEAAIAAGNFAASVKVGWDPTHVEPTGITISQARAGIRPV